MVVAVVKLVVAPADNNWCWVLLC